MHSDERLLPYSDSYLIFLRAENLNKVRVEEDEFATKSSIP
jgi:hypothetical protein